MGLWGNHDTLELLDILVYDHLPRASGPAFYPHQLRMHKGLLALNLSNVLIKTLSGLVNASADLSNPSNDLWKCSK